MLGVIFEHFSCAESDFELKFLFCWPRLEVMEVMGGHDFLIEILITVNKRWWELTSQKIDKTCLGRFKSHCGGVRGEGFRMLPVKC